MVDKNLLRYTCNLFLIILTMLSLFYLQVGQCQCLFPINKYITWKTWFASLFNTSQHHCWSSSTIEYFEEGNDAEYITHTHKTEKNWIFWSSIKMFQKIKLLIGRGQFCKVSENISVKTIIIKDKVYWLKCTYCIL